MTLSRQSRLIDAEAAIVWSPPKLVGLNVDALAADLPAPLLLEQRFSTPEELPPPVVTIAEKIAEVLALLAERDPAAR